jgi:protein-disulfide isomerase
MKLKSDNVMTVTLVICALVTTGLVVRREMSTSTVTHAVDHKPVFIQNFKPGPWQGFQIGPEDAPIQIVEFADFECPFCGQFHHILADIQKDYPNQISLTFVHFPLPGHRFASPAARVVECSGIQGKFVAMYDVLFNQQDSFGLKPWNDYAAAAGVPDLEAFGACIKETSLIPRVEAGKQLGTKLQVKGTPTVIINGWMLGRPPNVEELAVMVKAILAGKSPVPEGRKS